MTNRLATLLLAVGCHSAPPPALEKAPDLAADQAKQQDSLITHARGDAKLGEVDSADKSYEQAYAVKKDPDVLVERVTFLLKNGRTTKALSLAKGFHDGDGKADPRAYHLYAEALITAGDGGTAREVAVATLKLVPDDAKAHEQIGRALVLLDKPDDGVAEMRKAIALQPTDASFHVSTGLALHKLGRIGEAQLEFRAAIKTAPDNAEANALLGMALRDLNELDEAKKFLDKALELDPNNGRAHFELGLLYNRQGMQAEAEASLSKAVQLAPSESLFWYAYGEIYRLQQRNDEAIAAYKHAAELDPPSLKAMQKLGMVYAQRKKYDDAELITVQAIRREPKNATSYLVLADIYVGTRNKQAAIENYEKFLNLAKKDDPERDRARDAISGLRHR